jgi:uncharacterized membrane protein (UPF0136 family)
MSEPARLHLWSQDWVSVHRMQSRVRITPTCFRDGLFKLNFSGYLIQENKDYGTEVALGNSIALLGASVPRIIKTGGRAPVPLGLGTVGALATWYYQKKVREFRYGV